MVRILEAQTTYRRLLRTVSTKDLDNWLQEWEQALSEAKEVKIPDIEGVNGLLEFLNAVQSAFPSFYDYWDHNISQAYTENLEAVTGKELPMLLS